MKKIPVFLENFWIELLGTSSVVGGTFVTIFIEKMKHPESDVDFNEHFMMALLFEIMVLQFAILWKKHKSDILLERTIFERTISELMQNLKEVIEISEKSDNLLFKIFSQKTIQTYVESLKPSTQVGGITFKGGKHFLYRIYVIYWATLVDFLQPSNGLNKNKPVFVRIVHSTENDLWVKKNEFSDDLFRLQERFLRFIGSSIDRVFYSSQPNPDRNHLDRINYMIKKGINARYVQYQGAVDFDLFWVHIGNIDCVVKWYYDKNGCLVKCRILPFVDRDTRGVWENMN